MSLESPGPGFHNPHVKFKLKSDIYKNTSPNLPNNNPNYFLKYHKDINKKIMMKEGKNPDPATYSPLPQAFKTFSSL